MPRLSAPLPHFGIANVPAQCRRALQRGPLNSPKLAYYVLRSAIRAQDAHTTAVCQRERLTAAYGPALALRLFQAAAQR